MSNDAWSTLDEIFHLISTLSAGNANGYDELPDIGIVTKPSVSDGLIIVTNSSEIENLEKNNQEESLFSVLPSSSSFCSSSSQEGVCGTIFRIICRGFKSLYKYNDHKYERKYILEKKT